MKGRKQPNRPETPAVTLERAEPCLHCLLHLLRATPRPRDWLKNRLKSPDVRGFYRDLELLGSCGISVPLNEGCYILEGSVSNAVARLPFPDPRLTLGEAVQAGSRAHNRPSQAQGTTRCASPPQRPVPQNVPAAEGRRR